MPIVKIDQGFFNNDAQTNFNYLSHTDPGLDIENLSISQRNILLEGIRGTGKTHILKMIREETLKDSASKSILPIYITR
ncbi:hypothetical protein VO178_21705 [Lysinibacillus fusiformis]|uniref:ORC-CDC6 family AAA ATPase n=1 Tax=Lysinibacillus fusiformis TaxID=28031 RepID=UPI002D78FCC4|nr:hypothetical protein [Lysinibacillus fusiformis]WRS97925.1 hypothetical protein VO178_21705 [Lysinibacillus fusiformis]